MKTWTCQRDGACCQQMPAILMTHREWDVLKRRADALGLRPLIDTKDQWVAMKAGPCPFFKDGGCQVYEDRPYNCRRFQCGRWNVHAEPFITNPMPLIKSNNDLRWSYEKNQRAHMPWAEAHGWVRT